MTVALSNDYTTWTISSANLSSWTNISSVKLYIDSIEYTITQGNYTIVANPIDGVYSFILLINLNNGQVIKETYCYFVDKDVKCNVLNTVVKNEDSELAMFYYLLTKASNCPECDNSKKLFEIVKRRINDDCGCY